ncbi:hypothetical protein CLOBOL_01181 [Enterocloster bolteae ATCC BAA-613]|uniref:Uncharacterized protein n=1 Tax=Enterocloster bolteae (strain ATCC BAA-613 / DSM 15670 / CCUG 46953 / JCM 12243 / WAL 16351) TaxID=411902 RepID=A8RK27_ENTBW|nr:hypothetical protein CLOBOL_01181 [Enterocloster bolteae ATCC BAA-613]
MSTFPFRHWFHQLIKIIPAEGIGRAASIIREDTGEYPVGILHDVPGIIFNLYVVTGLLLFQLRADAAVCRYPQLPNFPG